METERKQNENGVAGLMKKTKTQLCEVILRKDEVETKLNSEVKSLTEEVSKLQNEVNTLETMKATVIKDNENKICKLNEELKDEIDELTSKVAEKNIVIKSLIVLIISVAIITGIIIFKILNF